MTKLREIADKLGLPIEKEFKFDNEDINGSLVFKISENGNLEFLHQIKKEWILSSWSLQDVYEKGYILIEETKQPKYATEDDVYYSMIWRILKDFIVNTNQLIDNSKDIINISNAKEYKNHLIKAFNETEKRLLNK